MNKIQQTAALNTAKTVLLFALGASILPILLFLVPMAWIGIAATAAIFFFLVKLVYEFEIDRLTRMENETEQEKK